jgi:hypothetical protein
VCRLRRAGGAGGGGALPAVAASARRRSAMIKDGRLTTNGWLFVVFLALVLTTPYNPFIAHRYLPIIWYFAVAIYGFWLLARVMKKEEAGQ